MENIIAQSLYFLLRNDSQVVITQNPSWKVIIPILIRLKVSNPKQEKIGVRLCWSVNAVLLASSSFPFWRLVPPKWVAFICNKRWKSRSTLVLQPPRASVKIQFENWFFFSRTPYAYACCLICKGSVFFTTSYSGGW